MKRKSTLVDSVSAEPEVSAVGRKRLSSVVIPQNKANRLRNVSSEPVYAAPLARRSQSPTRRRATFNFKLLTVNCILFLCCLLFGSAAWGQSTLDVYSSATDNHQYVPFYGYYADESQHNQMIYPSSELSAMNGKDIIQMVFYIDQTASNGSYTAADRMGTWTVSLGETANTTLSGLDNSTTLTQVYQGYFDCSTGMLTLTFDDSYHYNGGNLLVDFNHAAASYNRWYFLGVTATGASYTYGSQRDFLPKVTFTYETPSSCPKPTALSATTNVQNATITWIGSAGSYDIARSTNASASPDDCVVATGVSSNSYDFSSLSLADHYVWVRADCGGNGKSNWTAPVSFHIGYCNPAPTSIDNSGVTNITFGTGSNVVNNSTHPTSSPYYGDYTAQIGAVEAGVQASMSITYATSYTYNTYVWVDLNNNLTFEASEVVCYGESTSNNPTTLELNFTIPANQTPGDYRMRIGGADSGLGSDPNNANPCYSSSYGIFEDYTLRVLAPPSCLQPTGLSLSASGSSVTATWIGTASAYNIDINGVVTNNVTSPYTFTGSLATTYAIRVQADCATDGTSEWTSPQSVTTDLCLIANQCEISYSLTDQYNDSWNGASIDVVDSETSEIIATITMPDVSGPYTGSFNVCNGRTLNFVWTSGSYPGECGFVFTDSNDEGIINYTIGNPPSSGTFYTYTVNCGSCPKPTGLTVSNITGSSADISWTGSAESYNVRWSTLPIHNYTFDDGTMQGWTNLKVNADGGHWLNSDDNPGGYDYSVYAHSGSNFAMSYSFIDYDGAYNTNVYFISPQRYSIGANASLNFWYKFANSSYPDHMEVCVAIVDNPTASDFTSIWNSTTIDDWTEVNISLSTYAGQSIWIAFHHEDEDMYEVWVDDIAIELGYDWNYTTSNDNNITINGLSPNTTYVAQVQSDCGGDGTSNWSSTTFTTPFQISTVEEWNQFCDNVNGCTRDFYGETVFLAANIGPVSTMAGTSSCPFRGTFEGQGYKINVGISSSEQGAAPFRYISGATIQNLKVDGTVTSTAHHASGLVGFCADGSTNTIQNCHISTNVSNSNAYAGDGGNNYMGGIVGHNKGATTSIIGCVYDGTLTSQGFKGGMIGFADPPSPYTATVYITITDSYFAGSYSTNGYGDPNFSPVAVRAGHGFIFDLTSSNFYYNTDAGDFTATQYSFESNSNKDIHGTCKHAYSVTGVSPVTVAMNGTPTTYNVSGITAYSTGIEYDGTIYGGSGDVLALSLDGSSCGYEIDHGNLNGSSLTMEAHNTVISAPVYTISASVNPAGTGTVSGTGSYICGATATLEATANTGYHFVNWTKNSTEVSTSATYNFTVTEAADYVANFEINTYTVTTVIHPTEGGSAEGAGTYTHGSSCTLAATANTGYQFVNWTASNGSVVSANASYTFTVTGDVTYQANFTKTTVTSLPWTENFDNGYSCSSGNWEYLHGEWATPLRWTKAACVTYYRWGAYSDPYCLEMRANNSDNMVVLPQFDEPLNKLKVSFRIGRGNEASGYTVQLGYVTAPSDASTFTALDNIATPSSGVDHFDLYTYDLSTNNNSPSSSAYRLAIKYTKSGEDSWYLDNFDVRRVYTIAVSDDPSSTASSLTGAGKYDHGATCTVTATAGDCYNFVNWTENGTEVSTSASYSFTAEADRNLVANFTQWTLNIDNNQTSLECINTGTEVVLTASATSNSTPTYEWAVSSGSTEGTASSNTYTVSPTALSNTYTVSATVGGCERTQTATITTKPVITSEPSSSEGNEFCLGVSTDLSVESNASSFTWDNGAGSGSPVTVTPTATTTYKVSATSGSCVSTSSITITINTPDITDYDYIWRGVSDDWNYSSNWYMYSNSTYSVASGDMPTEAKNYYIGTGDCLPSSSWPSLSADATIGNVTIDGGSVTVPDGVTLSIAGTISGALTAEDGSTIEFVGSNDQTINDSQTFSNVTFSKGGANVITAANGLAVNGTATFTSGIVSGNVTFGEGGSSAGANLNSYVDGTVTKSGNGSSFTFPTGSDGVLGTITATITSGESAVAKFNHKSSGFDQEHDGYPRWWNVADMCGAEPFNHVSNFEYWDFNTTADLSGVTFVSKASSADAHFHNPSEYPADDSDIIQIAVYDGCWKNIGGHLEMSDENKTITISGVNASRGTTRSGSAITTFGSKDPSVVLPIELTSFTATCDGRSALVEWTTATEKNNDYFSLERSDDAINFTEVARVAGAGNSIEPIDYAYNDYGIYGGDNYYRLVQVDYDGTRTVSEVIVANCIEPESDGEPEVLAYPNPFSSELTVVLDNFGNRAATVEVYDMLGKLIYTNKVAAPQNSYETILNLSNLPPAAYTVRVSTNDFVINRNVVKN